MTTTSETESALRKSVAPEDAEIRHRANGGKGEGEREGTEEELDAARLRELETRDVRGDGKTASERQHEEMRRKRVSLYTSLSRTNHRRTNHR